MAGTHLKDFYGRLTGASRISRKVLISVNKDLVGKGKAPLEFWDNKGELKPTHDIIKDLRRTLGGYNNSTEKNDAGGYNTHQKMFVLEKIFGEQGGLAALGLMSTGTGSWEFVKGKILEVAGAEDKVTERLKGFNANLTALSGTATTTLASLFEPMLAPLTMANKELNNLVAGIGKLAEAHPAITTAANSIMAGTALYFGVKAGVGLYKGGKAGFKVWKGLKGAAGAAGGAGGAGAGALARISGLWGLAAGAGTTTASMLAARAGFVVMAGAGGYLLGTGLNKGMGALMGMSSQGRYKGDGAIGDMLYDILHGEGGYARHGSSSDAAKNDIKIEIHMYETGRTMIKTGGMNTQASITKMARSFLFDSLLTGGS